VDKEGYGKTDRTGLHMIVPVTDARKQAFLRWLCTPQKEREPRSLTAFAETIGVERNTLGAWRDDKEFLEAWEKLYLRTIGDPSKKSEIMQTLFRTATDQDDPKHVQAAKAYFEIEGSMKPSRMEVTVQRPAAELTDDQLATLLAERAEAEKAQRIRAVE
jgi:Helix-turn-helix of insertion element transposase